jgi:hypothetical protein
MKPIETTYKGCHFRSRLEARWAVFFDSLGVRWEYEREGFELRSRRYLPDFWLPEMDCFFEAKGQEPSDSEKQSALELSIESRKLVALASGFMGVEELRVGSRSLGEWLAAGFNIELFAGEAHDTWAVKSFDFPMWNWMFEVDLPPFIEKTFPTERIPEGDSEERRARLIELDRRYYHQKCQKDHPKYRWGRHESSLSWVKCNDGYRFAHEPDPEANEISRAFNAARSARFEFGQSGV